MSQEFTSEEQDQINEVIDAKAYAKAIVDELLSQRAKITELEHDREQLRNKYKNAKATLLSALRERNELEAEVARLREDGAMLTFLEKLISHCPHAEFYFTDDPYEEAPLGFSITIEGCEKSQVSGPTLRDAIRAEMTHSAAIDAANVSRREMRGRKI